MLRAAKSRVEERRITRRMRQVEDEVNASLLLDEQSYHFEHKTVGLQPNSTHLKWQDKMRRARTEVKRKTCEKKMKSIPHHKCNKCHHCGKRTPHGCSLCEVYLHINPTCWNNFHEKEVLGADEGHEERSRRASSDRNRRRRKRRREGHEDGAADGGGDDDGAIVHALI